jgi:hypothetical protein
MEPKGLLPGSCHPTTGRCAKADECSLHVCTIFIIIIIIIIIILIIIIIIIIALQSLVKLSLFQNCPPLFSVLLLPSPVLQAHLL